MAKLGFIDQIGSGHLVEILETTFTYCQVQRFGRNGTVRCSAPQSLKVARCEKSSRAVKESILRLRD